MNDPLTPKEGTRQEARLSEVFQTLTPRLEDEGFSSRVLGRIGRRLWLRRLVLGTAVAVGGVLALGPVTELAVMLSEGLVVAATRWNDPAWLAQNQALLVLSLLAVACPGAIRLLEQ